MPSTTPTTIRMRAQATDRLTTMSSVLRSVAAARATQMLPNSVTRYHATRPASRLSNVPTTGAANCPERSGRPSR